MKNRKHHVTLIEMIIAMSLTSLLLLTVMFFYREVVTVGAEIDQVKIEEFHTRYAESRLAYVIPRTVSAKDKQGDFAFFSTNDSPLAMPGSQSLIFSFDNGISLDKVFSNNIIGRLLLSPKGELLLLYWPMPKRWTDPSEPLPMKQELLLSGVASLQFEFFVAPPTAKKQGDKAHELPSGWHRDLWLQDFGQLPVMVKVLITLEKENEKLVYVFLLAKNTTPILL